MRNEKSSLIIIITGALNLLDMQVATLQLKLDKLLTVI